MMQSRAQRLTSGDLPIEPSVSVDNDWQRKIKSAIEEALSTKDIVLSAEPNPSDLEIPASDIDWPSAIEHIRDVAARVRRARDFAQEVSRHSQSIIQRSLKQTEDAERRADAAEAATGAALLRAEKAEELARLSEARTQLAVKESAAAKANEAEAQLWLRRVHACLKDEFNDLTVDPV